MFFGFQLTCGLMLVFYGYSVMKKRNEKKSK